MDSNIMESFLQSVPSIVWFAVREERKVQFMWDPWVKRFPSSNNKEHSDAVISACCKRLSLVLYTGLSRRELVT
ncbi:hypothetical protein MTR_4g128280 [Medicago truncatula]|uniref:Uncharacterized protein n=1 Tax=Medicago truncatula TaxID=3880 RepID=G7JVH1_MEDTR|nr:hypothetical protein MTR_4g128280 [Medicago truncatula]